MYFCRNLNMFIKEKLKYFTRPKQISPDLSGVSGDFRIVCKIRRIQFHGTGFRFSIRLRFLQVLFPALLRHSSNSLEDVKHRYVTEAKNKDTRKEMLKFVIAKTKHIGWDVGGKKKEGKIWTLGKYMYMYVSVFREDRCVYRIQGEGHWADRGDMGL